MHLPCWRVAARAYGGFGPLACGTMLPSRSDLGGEYSMTRLFYKGVVAGILLVLLAACGGSPASPTATTVAPPAASTAYPAPAEAPPIVTGYPAPVEVQQTVTAYPAPAP